MSLFKRGGIWWYRFFFAGQLIRESSRSTSKTIAKSAEQERRRELEAGYNNVKEVRRNRIRFLAETRDDYRLRLPARYWSNQSPNPRRWNRSGLRGMRSENRCASSARNEGSSH